MARTEPEVKLSASARWSRAMGQINEARFRGPGHLHQYLDSLDQAFDTLTSLDAYPGDVTQDEIELRFEQVFRMSLEAFVRFDPDTLRDRAAADRLVQLPLKSAQRAGAKGNAMLGATISALTDMLARLETKPSNTAFRARIAERRNGLWNELLGRSQAAWHSSSASRESLFTSIAVLMSLFCTLEPEEPHTVDCMRQVRKIPEAHARLEEIVQKPPFEVNEDEPLAAVFARGVSALDRRARTSPP